MQKSVRPLVINQSKLEQIRSGAKIKTQTGVKENKNIVSHKDGKYAVHQKEEKYEETGVRKKKSNYVMYESKLGTERMTNLTKIEEAKLSKPKPKPAPIPPRPRQEEKIIQTKKKVEYLDNYQYHETKDIKRPNPNRISIVTHQRLGDVVGGSYEESTIQKITMNDPGRGPKKYSQQTEKTTVRRGAPYKPGLDLPRSNTAPRTLPAQSREYRNEIKRQQQQPQRQQYSSNTNVRSAPKKEQISTRTVNTRTTRTTTNAERPGRKADNEHTRVQKTTTTNTRGQTTSASTGRRRQ